jgi:Zn-dependent M32 family carboxypeptidase
VSTHLSEADARSIITNGQKKFYNVCAVFFSNSIEKQRQQNEEISILNWDDRWVVANQTTEDEAQQMTQLNKAAESFVQILIERTRGW